MRSTYSRTSLTRAWLKMVLLLLLLLLAKVIELWSRCSSLVRSPTGLGDIMQMLTKSLLKSFKPTWVGWHYQAKAAAVHYTSLKDGDLDKE